MNQRSKVLFKDMASFIQAANKDTQQNTKLNAVKNFISTNELGRDLIKYVYNNTSDWKFGLTGKSLDQKVSAQTRLYDDLFQMLDDLRSGSLTGHAAIFAAQNFTDTPQEQKILSNILDKNLKIRMGADLINRVEPLVEVFDVALANKYETGKHNLVGDYFISRKMDGCRLLTFVDLQKKEVRFLSREGNPFLTLEKLIPAVEQMAQAYREITDYDGVQVFDGEVSVITPDGSDDFKSIIKQIKSFKKGCVDKPKYHIIDILTEEEFYSKKTSHLFKDRYDYINKAYKRMQTIKNVVVCTHIEPVLQHEIKSVEQLDKMIAFAADKGWEGLIARLNASYRSGRHDDLLKIKKMQSMELRVKDVITGPFQVVNAAAITITENVMTNVIVDYEGFDVSVGSGFTLNERRKYKEDPNSLIGKMIEVQYFEKTDNQKGGKSLRFPIFKGERSNLL